MAYAIDLFSGAGGMSEGIIQAGFHILFSSDINKAVEKTYINRHNQLGLIQGKNTYFKRADIKDLTGDYIKKSIENLEIFENKKIPNIDAIFGGPPCQGFSRAGKRNPNDPRNKLFKEYIRVINEIKPDYVILENVSGFCDTKLYEFNGINGNKYKEGTNIPNILNKEFNSINYTMLKPQILNAIDYGVPQRRKRVIVIAYKKGKKAPKYPKPITGNDKHVTFLEATGDLIQDKIVRNNLNSTFTQYQLDSINGRTPDINGNTIKSKKIKNNEISQHLPLIKERFSLFKEGESGSNLKKRINKEGIDLSNKHYLLKYLVKNSNLDKKEIITEFKKGTANKELLNLLLTKKNIRTKLNKNESSLTIMTIPDDYISPIENRTLTVRESARLQSFDDSFEFLGKRTTGGKKRRIEIPQYSQVGNAVPPLLAKAVAKEILNVINNF